MDNKKKLSLKLKDGKEELSKKALDEFISRSSGNIGHVSSFKGSDKKNTDRLTKQEERNRLDALYNYKKLNAVAASTHTKQPEPSDKVPESGKESESQHSPDKKELSTRTTSTWIIDPETPRSRPRSSFNTSSSTEPVTVSAAEPSAETSGDSADRKSEKSKYSEKSNTDVKRPQRNKRDSVSVDTKSAHLSYDEYTKEDPLKSSNFRKNYKKSSSNNRKKTIVNLKKGQLITIEKRLITPRELSMLLSEPMSKVMTLLKKMGETFGEDDFLKKDIVEILALELGHEIKYKLSAAELLTKERENVDNSSMKNRAPVVTVMGHIDHGKTTLLDTLRHTHVTASESGGITQHIGAYQVQTKDGRSITFIDTPGHAAFTSMRMRGAEVTDIVVLLVAADDGVNEQTIEAIKHAKAAKVPIIVAINKIDKEGANPLKVMTDLLQHGVVVEEMQGDVMSVNISAKNGTNIDKLEELILLQADFLELKYNPSKQAEGVVIESKLDKRCGAFATIIVKEGELKTGELIVASGSYGKVKSMTDSSNKKVKKAPAGVPVEVLGLNKAPEPGTYFFVVKNEKDAKAMLDSQERDKVDNTRSLRDSFENEKKKLNFIIKADVNGSVEAITESIKGLSHPDIEISIIHTSVGDINDSDLLLAEVSDSYIIGFRVKAERTVKEHSAILFHSIIYDVIKHVQDLMTELVSPKTREVVLGSALVKEVFTLSDKSSVAGCQVKSGVIKKSARIRIVRDGQILKDLSIKSLKRFKDEVKEVKPGYECGILLNGYSDFKVGDILESFESVSNEK
ncbi:translation initiation factor IF-2 [Neorickettsia helminthoeca str. Oregon]|uniref:Translation initiation factor IF-2 n=1 Tax=Neorickettsia helminthoeca str. Oregon TaxID=1286528 RepID=X5HLY1_9RICK|nr:translation initiation factor IF-2 [Neorickettsia helminthoeca]AHX11440.1 translation initiation factor IF-2 [Neorickettsia helminthoeca str. Oregon]